MARPLTTNQIATLKRVARGEFGRDFIRPDLARQLIGRGLVTRCTVRPTYQRVEWNRPVVGTTLWGVKITEAGRNAIDL